MTNELFEMADKIIEGQKKIREIRADISEPLEKVKELILHRLMEHEAICKELNRDYGKYGDPTPSASKHFGIHDIEIHEDYSVEFTWTDNWAYGGHDEGHMTLTKDEFLAGDFTELRKQLEQRPKEIGRRP